MAWIPARAGAHVPKKTIAQGTSDEFLKPPGANGFIIGGNAPFYLTFDGSTASATNGLLIDPGKGQLSSLVPVTPEGKLSIFNDGTGNVDVEVAWVEDTDAAL